MYDFWRDPLWQSVGALISLAGIFISIVIALVIFLLQRNRKSLVFDIVAVTRLSPSFENIDNNIQISYKGNIISDVWLALISIINDGISPITAEEYVKSLSIELNSEAVILSSEVVETIPKGIDARINSTIDRVTLEPVLLNAFDSITIKILVSNLYSNPQVVGRIVGISKIRQADHRGVFNSSWQLFFWSSLLLLVLLFFAAWIKSMLLVVGIFIAWLVIIYVPTSYDYKYKNLWKRFMFG